MGTPYPSIRVFKSDLFEWFSHIHPLTPLVVWGPFALTLIVRSFTVLHIPAASVLGLSVLALAAWSLTEYVLHRFVFHIQAQGPFWERFQFIMHGIHHSDPMDPTRLVMAPVVSLGIAAVLYPIFRAIFGVDLVQPFFGFFLMGYLAYDYTHYAVHHFTPRTRVGKALKQNHMIHHYVDHDLRWGVSSPLWDFVFGTLHRKRPVDKRRPSTRKAGVYANSRVDLLRRQS